MDQNSILEEFQTFLRGRGIVAEKKVPFYAFWVGRFLAFSNEHDELPLDLLDVGHMPGAK